MSTQKISYVLAIATIILTVPQTVFSQDTFQGSQTRKNPDLLFEQWESLIKNQHTFNEIVDFIQEHPDWPALKSLQKKAEETLALEDINYNPNDASSKEQLLKIFNFFHKYPPITGNGQFIYAKTLQSLEHNRLVKEAFHKLVTSFIIPDNVIQALASYKKHLPFLWASLQANHLMLIQRGDLLDKIMPYLDFAEKRRMNIRRRLQRKDASVVQEAYSVIQKPGNNQGVILDLIRYHVAFDSKEEDEKAFNLFKSYLFSDEVLHPKTYWKIRHKVARSLISQRRYHDAFDVLKNHGYTILSKTNHQQVICDEDCANAICTASWLGISYGNNSSQALTQLKDALAVVKSPITKARMLFWISKAHVALKQIPLAFKALMDTSLYKSTFYGQIAISMLKRSEFQKLQLLFKTNNDVPQDNLFPETTITENDTKNFESLDLVRVIRSVPDALSNSNANLFFNALLNVDSSLVFQHQVFNLAQEKKNRSFAILLSKTKHMTFKFVYPLIRKETKKQSIDKISPKTQYAEFLSALTHAIIRRESAFDEEAISSANAKGLMQILQSTANREEKILREKYNLYIQKPINLYNKITNIQLGVSHLTTLLNEFNGSLILAIAAYNAGPTPVKRWVTQYGDPQRPDIDIINWIESIPYWETRNYVQRVLENLTVYEQLLDEASEYQPNTDLLERIKPREEQQTT